MKLRLIANRFRLLPVEHHRGEVGANGVAMIRTTVGIGLWNESLAIADFDGDGLADAGVSNSTGFAPSSPSLYLFLSRYR